MTKTETTDLIAAAIATATPRLHRAVAALATTGADTSDIEQRMAQTMPDGTIKPTALTYVASVAQAMMTEEGFAVRDAAQNLRGVILLRKRHSLTPTELRFLAEMSA